MALSKATMPPERVTRTQDIKLPPGTKLAEGATITAPKGYQVMQGSGAVKLDGFELPETRAARRRPAPVSKLHPSVTKGTTDPNKVLFLSDRPVFASRASKRSVRRANAR